jgi:acetyl-CoA decarbonylase/synthase, CODH/ACS complex subunit gamma
MAKKLSGLKIQKLLPKTNCKECGSNTCMAFAMKLAAKKVDLALCPYVSEEAIQIIGAASAPPVKSLKVGKDQTLKLGEETVLYRHEKTFVNRTAVAINLNDTDAADYIDATLKEISDYLLERAGQEIFIDMLCISHTKTTSDSDKFLALVKKVQNVSALPLILRSSNPDVLIEAADLTKGAHCILVGANRDSVGKLKVAARDNGHILAISESDIDAMVKITSDLKNEGFSDLVLDFQATTLAESLMINTIARRAAIKDSFKPLGYPFLRFLSSEDPIENTVIAFTEAAKYGGVCVLPSFDKAQLIALLTMRMGIYTDPQKPIQVEPKIYPIGEPTKDSRVFITTNFSLTFFIVSGEIENSGISAWLVVPECEGMSVLTAWAAGKFNANSITKFFKSIDLENQISCRELIIPGYVSQISGELGELLPNWKILVGPQDAADIESYIISLKSS